MKEYPEPKNIVKTYYTKKDIKARHPDISLSRKEEEVFFLGTKRWESSYSGIVACREIENGTLGNYWLVYANVSSKDVGNNVYKKNLYFSSQSKAESTFKEMVARLKGIRDESEINNIPSSTIPHMVWYALYDFSGDEDIKPKSAGNINYLRQDHNMEAEKDSKGNLFKNILYLDKANWNAVEKSNGNAPTNNYF